MTSTAIYPASPKQIDWLGRFAARLARDTDFLRGLSAEVLATLTEVGAGREVSGRDASAALDECFAAPREVVAGAAPCPAGKTEVTGEIVKIEYRTSQYGGAYKMTVRVSSDNHGGSGYLLWGTRPASLSGAEAGDRVGFTATLEPSDRDPGFGFYRRPTGAVRLAAGGPAPTAPTADHTDLESGNEMDWAAG